MGDQGPTDSPAQQRFEKCLDLGMDLLYGVGGYNISPSLFFIEIFNNDKGNFGGLRGTQQPYLGVCGAPGWPVLGERTKLIREDQ